MGLNPVKLALGVLKTGAKLIGLNLSAPEGGILEDAAVILERLKDSPEMKAAMLEQEVEMKRLAIEEMRVANEEGLAMIQSQSRFVSWARPMGLYLFYGCCVALVIGHLAGRPIDPNLWTVIAPLGGVGGLYTWKRTQEKMNGNH